jgi:hypothetical protein
MGVMDRKRKSTNESSSSPTKKRAKIESQKPRKPPRGRASAIQNWTTNTFENIQCIRTGSNYPLCDIGRSPKNAEQRKKKASKTNGAIAQYMRNSGVKTPNIPLHIAERPKYLYRGFVGLQALTIMEYGTIRSNAFISFSISPHVADMFSYYGANIGVIIRLDISKLRHGIPWIWFAYNKQSERRPRETIKTARDEQEVLLPPGELRPIRKISPNGKEMYTVEYTPDPNALSIRGKKIIRRLGPAKRDIDHTPDRYERVVSNMLSKLLL